VTAPTAIQIDRLHVVRRGRDVLRSVSLEVPERRVTGLLGPSGSGKSTLMRSIVGVQRISAGDVRVLGLPAGTRELRRRVGYMTQELSVYRDLSIRENLGYFGRLLGAQPARTDEVIDQVDLGDVAARKVEMLSGGQQARVSLAVALLGDPQVLILDEPTVGLDPLLRRRLWRLFHELADAGRTLLVSSHVMDEAAHCDDLVLLREGQVLAAAPPDVLMASSGERDLEAAFVALIDRAGAE
jgi:ABC-2 type transport system ATP-binding protein